MLAAHTVRQAAVTVDGCCGIVHVGGCTVGELACGGSTAQGSSWLRADMQRVSVQSPRRGPRGAVQQEAAMCCYEGRNQGGVPLCWQW
jgi:hypothetical protein